MKRKNVNIYDILTALMIMLVLMLVWLFLASNAYACTAFYQGEYVSGMNRICIYNHLGSDVAYTVSAVDLCPISLEVPH